MIRRRATGILIREKKLLVTRTKGKQWFVLPGGGMAEGEHGADSLLRELREELGLTAAPEEIEPFGRFDTPAVWDPADRVIVEAFLVRSWSGSPAPREEIEEIAWVGAAPPEGIQLWPVFSEEILPRLHALGLIE